MTQPCRIIVVDAAERLGEWSQALGMAAPLPRAVLAEWGVSARAEIVQAVADGARVRAAMAAFPQSSGWRLRLCQHDQHQLLAIVENRHGVRATSELIQLVRGWCLGSTGRDAALASTSTLPSGKTIVLVEDDYLVRSVCRRMLSDHYMTHEAASGRGALALGEWLPMPVDLLISDVNLPRMDGITLSKQWLQKSPRTRVLLLSGSYLPEMGCDLPAIFLQKPFRGEELLHCAELTLGSSALGPALSSAMDSSLGAPAAT